MVTPLSTLVVKTLPVVRAGTVPDRGRVKWGVTGVGLGYVIFWGEDGIIGDGFESDVCVRTVRNVWYCVTSMGTLGELGLLSRVVRSGIWEMSELVASS
jgi:hypothetical protein